MKHARADYNVRIQDAALKDRTLLPEGCEPFGADEPVFILRAKDELASDIVRKWADDYEDRGGDPAVVEAVRRHAQAMDEWGNENDTKLPDTPTGLLEA